MLKLHNFLIQISSIWALLILFCPFFTNCTQPSSLNPRYWFEPSYSSAMNGKTNLQKNWLARALDTILPLHKAHINTYIHTGSYRAYPYNTMIENGGRKYKSSQPSYRCTRKIFIWNSKAFTLSLIYVQQYNKYSLYGVLWFKAHFIKAPYLKGERENERTIVLIQVYVVSLAFYIIVLNDLTLPLWSWCMKWIFSWW